MPKQPTVQRQIQRPTPYSLRTSTAMVTNMPQTMPQWGNPHMHSMSYSDHGLHYGQQHMMPAYLPAPPAMPVAPQMHREAVSKPRQSGPWNSDEDSILIDAKGRGKSWEEIHQQHFPGKSANACRKRHERVLAKMRNTDWDDARIQRVTEAYNRHRHLIWAPLCKELNENVSDVEKVVCERYSLSVKQKLKKCILAVPTRAPKSEESIATQSHAPPITSEFRPGRVERV